MSSDQKTLLILSNGILYAAIIRLADWEDKGILTRKMTLKKRAVKKILQARAWDMTKTRVAGIINGMADFDEINFTWVYVPKEDESYVGV